MKRTNLTVIIVLLLINFQGETLFAQTGIITSEEGFDGAVQAENTQQTNGLNFVTVTIPYLGMNGETLKGQARFYYRPELLKSTDKIPVYCGVHYESSEKTIREYSDMGMAVVTPYYGEISGKFPCGNSINFSKAIIQWARRLPFVDRSKMIFGGPGADLALTIFENDMKSKTWYTLSTIEMITSRKFFTLNSGPGTAKETCNPIIVTWL